MKSTATWANVAIDPPGPSGVIVGVPPLSTDKLAVWSNWNPLTMTGTIS